MGYEILYSHNEKKKQEKVIPSQYYIAKGWIFWKHFEIFSIDQLTVQYPISDFYNLSPRVSFIIL